MIFAFRLVPAATHDEQPSWAYPPYTLNDESELTPLPDGEYAIFAPTKAIVSERDAANDLFKGWTFDRIVTVSTPVSKSKVTTTA